MFCIFNAKYLRVMPYDVHILMTGITVYSRHLNELNAHIRHFLTTFCWSQWLAAEQVAVPPECCCSPGEGGEKV